MSWLVAGADVADVTARGEGCAGLHLRGLPTRAKIKELHEYWFDTGHPLIIELAR